MTMMTARTRQPAQRAALREVAAAGGAVVTMPGGARRGLLLRVAGPLAGYALAASDWPPPSPRPRILDTAPFRLDADASSPPRAAPAPPARACRPTSSTASSPCSPAVATAPSPTTCP
ncbi:MAG: hypothetical protein U0802_07615 [Candidatus Binatia bacterium]